MKFDESSENSPGPRDITGDVELRTEGDALHLVDTERTDAVAKDGKVAAPAEPPAQGLDVDEKAAEDLARLRTVGRERKE